MSGTQSRARAATQSSAGAAALTRRIAACTECAPRFKATVTGHAPRPVTVINASARVLLAGQAPGARVHASGVPFDDASGDRLRAWMGVGRETFYDPARIAILPMAFCFPGYDAKGADLPPPPVCARLWREQAMAALPRLRLILLIGGHAQRWHLGKPHRKVDELVRDWRARTEGAPAIIPLPHPSWRNSGWLKRNPWFDAETLPWLRAALAPLLEGPEC